MTSDLPGSIEAAKGRVVLATTEVDKRGRGNFLGTGPGAAGGDRGPVRKRAVADGPR